MTNQHMDTIPKPPPTFAIKVMPNAKESSISFVDGAYKARLNAPADKGKANKELLKLLKKWLGKAQIISGERSREKVISWK